MRKKGRKKKNGVQRRWLEAQEHEETRKPQIRWARCEMTNFWRTQKFGLKGRRWPRSSHSSRYCARQSPQRRQNSERSWANSLFRAGPAQRRKGATRSPQPLLGSRAYHNFHRSSRSTDYASSRKSWRLLYFVHKQGGSLREVLFRASRCVGIQEIIDAEELRHRTGIC